MKSIQRDLAVGTDIFLRGFGGYEIKLKSCLTRWYNISILGIPLACEATDRDFLNSERNLSLLTFIDHPFY